MKQDTALMGVAEVTDRPANKWFTAWGAADFSWDGLAQVDWSAALDRRAGFKRWKAPVEFPGDGDVVGEGQHAFRQATLQDYWRWSFGFEEILSEEDRDTPVRLTDQQLIDAGLLVEFDGKLWHILHREALRFSNPLSDDSEGLGLLARALIKRLQTAGPNLGGSATGSEDIGGVDNRVQLCGARLKNIDMVLQRVGRVPEGFSPPALYVRCPLSEFDRFDGSGLRFGDTSDFEQSKFDKKCRFNKTIFGDRVRFDQSYFGDSTAFYSAQFGSAASFERCKFGDKINFTSAVFGEAVTFQHANFASFVTFGDGVFGDAANFRSCTMPLAKFQSAKLGNGANFFKTQFGDKVEFVDASLPYALFRETQFGGVVEFNSADLSHSHLQYIDLTKNEVDWTSVSLVDCEFKEVEYERDRLVGKCRGMKGVASIWGDALLKRDLQDQDYIDTLDAKQKETKPKLIRKPDEPETRSERASRIYENLKRLLDPRASLSEWRAILGGAIASGLVLGFIIYPNVIDLSGPHPNGMVLSIGLKLLAYLLIALSCTFVAGFLIVFAKSWGGQRFNFRVWRMLGFGRDWDRVARLAMLLIIVFGGFYALANGTHVTFACEDLDLTTGECNVKAPGYDHWFMPWFVAAMGFSTLGIVDVAQPITGLGQILMIINVLAGFTIFGLLLAVLGNRFARRS